MKSGSLEKQRGMSLIEVLVAIGLISLFMMTAITFLLFMMRSEVKVAAIQEINWQAQEVLMQIRQDLTGVESIESPGKGTSGEVLEFADSQGVHQFYKDEDDLFFQREGDTLVQLNQGDVIVDAFVPTNLSFDEVLVVGIQLTLSVMVKNEHIQETFYTSVTIP